MIIQNVHYTLNKNSRYFFQLLPGCWTGVLTVRLVKLSLLNLTAKNFCKTFFELKMQSNTSSETDRQQMIFIQCIILLLQLTSPSGTVRKLFCIYGGNHCQKKTVTYASVWLMSEKLETAMKHFVEEFIWLTFFFLKIGHILFHYVNKLLRLT